MTVLRMAVMTWADDPARSRCASSCKVASRMVQGLDVPVAAGRSGDGLRPAAALDGAAGDAEGGNGGAGLAAVRVTDGPLDKERLGGVPEQARWGGQHPDGPSLVPAVPAVMHDVRDRCVLGPGGCETARRAGCSTVRTRGVVPVSRGRRRCCRLVW